MTVQAEYDDEAAEARRITQAQEAVQVLATSNADLAMLIEQLTDRLRPVLRPLNDRPMAVEGGPAPDAVSEVAPLPDELFAQARLVREGCDRLGMLLARLEV